MKRAAELAPLSRDHHVALEHALRLQRAEPAGLDLVVARFLAFLLADGRRHFAQEEEILRCAAALGDAPDVEAARALGALLEARLNA